MKKFSRILLGICLVVTGSAWAQDWDKVELQSLELGPGAWMLYGAGGNHVLLDGPEGALIVDTDYGEVSGKLLKLVGELTGGPPAQAVITHWHFDHVGGNQTLREAGARLFAHENVRSRMAEGSYLAVIDHEEPPADPAALPDQTFDSQLVLEMGDETVEVFHVPGAHTDGDAMVYLKKANVLHTGDVVFFCGYPFIDINAGGTIDGMIGAVKKAMEFCDDETQVVPGHGPLTDKAGLDQYLGMLEAFRDAVFVAKTEGMTLEELLVSEVTAEVDAEWDNKMFPSVAFRELVYRSLP